MKLYRYQMGHCEEMFGDWSVKLDLLEFNVIGETKCTYLFMYRGREKRVRKGAEKSFAYGTKKAALDNYIQRTDMHIQLLRSRIEDAQTALKLAVSLREANNQ